MRQSVVSMIIFLYIFISAALLLFNVVYMLGASIKDRIMERRIRKEAEEQRRVMKDVGTRADRRYQRRLFQNLKNAERLWVYMEALERSRSMTEKENVTAYMRVLRDVLFDIAEVYRKRPAMERALFAYLISRLPHGTEKEYRRMGELLLPYLKQSTVYCRENVLQALYQLGNEDALLRAFQIFQENGWNHDPKLISDGMAEFCGDKVSLARKLWKYEWNDTMKATLIQFMSRLQEDLSELVLPELKSGAREPCFAAIRYFGSHINKKAKPILFEILQEDDDVAASAARALGNYSGKKTKRVLKQALRSRNWYVRHNAAESLANIDLSEKEKKRLLEDEDRYAREMFRYVLESRGRTS